MLEQHNMYNYNKKCVRIVIKTVFQILINLDYHIDNIINVDK